MEKLYIIILLNLIFYFKTLRFGYVSDDIDVKNKKFSDNTSKLKYFIYQLRGDYYKYPEIEHLTNLIIHTTVCSLIYLCFGMNNISFIAALLFSVNPINQQGAIWLSGKNYAATAIIVLLCYKFKYLSIFLYPLTYFTASNALLFPLLFLFTKYWYLVALIPLIIYFKFKRLENGIKFRWENEVPLPSRVYDIDRISLAIKQFTYFFLNCLLPRRLGMYHTFTFSFILTPEDKKYWGRRDKWFWGGLLLIGAIIYAIITNINNLFGIGLLLYCISISQWVSFFYIYHQPMAERYCYLANIGLMLSLSYLIYNLPILVTFFMTYYSLRGYINLNAYKNNKLFLEYNLYDFNHPDQFFCYVIKAERELREDGQFYQFLQSLATGLTYRPTDHRIHSRLATGLANYDPRIAKEHLEYAKKYTYNGRCVDNLEALEQCINRNLEKIKVKVA